MGKDKTTFLRLTHSMPLDIVGAAGIVDEICERIAFIEGMVFICGNGGDAALADHFETDLLKFGQINARSLCSNSSLITMIGNDYGYENVFLWQLNCYSRPEDALICLSTSGKSPNILCAAQWANTRGLLVVSITGADPEISLIEKSDYAISIEGKSTMDIEDAQSTLLHYISSLVGKHKRRETAYE